MVTKWLILPPHTPKTSMMLLTCNIENHIQIYKLKGKRHYFCYFTAKFWAACFSVILCNSYERPFYKYTLLENAVNHLHCNFMKEFSCKELW